MHPPGFCPLQCYDWARNGHQTAISVPFVHLFFLEDDDKGKRGREGKAKNNMDEEKQTFLCPYRTQSYISFILNHFRFVPLLISRPGPNTVFPDITLTVQRKATLFTVTTDHCVPLIDRCLTNRVNASDRFTLDSFSVRLPTHR